MLKTLRRKIVGDLRANRGQFFAVWLVITLGTAFYGALYPAGVNMLASIYRTYDQLSYMDFQVQLESATPEVVGAVRAIPGVAHAEGRLVVESGLQVRPTQQYLIDLRLISVPDDRAPEVNVPQVMQGRAIAAAGEVLLLRSFAEKHSLRSGDTLHVLIGDEWRDLRVAGLAFSPEYLVSGRSPSSPFPTPSTFGVAWIRYSELAAWAGRDGAINDIAIRLPGRSSDRQESLQDPVRQALSMLFAGDASAVILSRVQTASGGVVDANINGAFPLMRFYSGLFLAGATIVTGILLARLVESERRRIGTLRSLGVTRRELVLHYLAFGVIIGVAGGLAGSVLGYLNSFWVMNTFLSYIAGGSIPGFVNTPQIPFILLGFVVIVAGSTFAGAYPVSVQSATPPGIALRPATPRTPNTISRIPLGWLPLVVRQAVRNLLRTPGRSLGTALGMLAGTMMIFSSLAMTDTLNSCFGDYFRANAFDLRVDLGSLTPGEPLEAQVQKLSGVTGAQAALIGPVTAIRADGETFDTVAVALDERAPFITPKTLQGSPAFSSADGVWIGHNLQRALGVGVGDTITLRALGQERPVKVLGSVSYALGSPVFIPRGLLRQWAPGGVFPANAVLVRAQPGQDTAVRDALAALPGVVAVEVFEDFKSDLNHYLEWFRVGSLIFGSFGYILALALLFNTVNASLRERREELSILRALGSTRGEIALTVTLELLAMVLLGAASGVPLGREAGFWMNRSYETEFFGQVNTILVRSYVVGLVSLVIVVMLAEIPGLRAVQRVDLGQVSKSQSF
jgi:putative ABC transport system permease protein